MNDAERHPELLDEKTKRRVIVVERTFFKNDYEEAAYMISTRYFRTIINRQEMENKGKEVITLITDQLKLIGDIYCRK